MDAACSSIAALWSGYSEDTQREEPSAEARRAATLDCGGEEGQGPGGAGVGGGVGRMGSGETEQTGTTGVRGSALQPLRR